MRIILSIILASASVLLAAKPQRAGEELLRSLIKQKPWDRQRLAAILKLEFVGATSDPDYIADALDILLRLALEVPLEKEIERLMLWKVTAADGRQHWLFGTHHHLALDNFSVEARARLDAIAQQSRVNLYEGWWHPVGQREMRYFGKKWEKLLTPILPSPKQLDEQLVMLGVEHGASTVPLDSISDIIDRHKELKQVSERAIADHRATAATMQVDKLVMKVVDDIEVIFAGQQAYVDADHDRSAVLFALQSKDIRHAAMFHIMVAPRNRNWVEKIIAAFEQQNNCLVIAGCAHMLADVDEITSLVTLLQERDYRVEFVE